MIAPKHKKETAVNAGPIVPIGLQGHASLLGSLITFKGDGRLFVSFDCGEAALGGASTLIVRTADGASLAYKGGDLRYD